MKFFSKKIKHDRIPIAVDFDGVIHKYSKGFFDGSIYDEPVDGVVEALRELQKDYYIYIFSNRNETPEGEMAVLEYLKKYNIPFDKISATKPPAKFFIDDGAIRFDTWEQVKKDLEFFKKT
jgi:hypothetical protein